MIHGSSLYVLPRIIAGVLLILMAVLQENMMSYFDEINILENQSILVDQAVIGLMYYFDVMRLLQ